MSVKQLASGHWQIRFKLKGFPRYRKVHPEARRQRDAEAIEARLRQLVFERKWQPSYGEELFADFCRDTYLPSARAEKKSWRSDVVFIGQVIPYFKGLRLIDITSEHVRKFRDARASDETRPGQLRGKGTLRREMSMLKRIFNYAIELERLQVNPCKKVKFPTVPDEKTRVLSIAEESRVLDVLREHAPHVVTLVRLALQTGMRRGEILKLKPKYANLEITSSLQGERTFGWLTLPGAICKSGKPRSIPLTEEANQILSEAIEGVDPERMIFQGKGYTPGYVTHIFTCACRKAQVDEATFHTLRHTYGTRLASAGIHQATIKEILGHGSLQQTDRYVHPDSEMKQRAARALSEMSEAQIIPLKKRKSGKP